MAQGGDFVSGALTGAVSAGASLAMDGSGLMGHSGDGDAGNIAARTAIAAIAGGTASVLSGGKFANGAITGAFAQLYNEEADASWEMSDADRAKQQEALNDLADWVWSESGASDVHGCATNPSAMGCAWAAAAAMPGPPGKGAALHSLDDLFRAATALDRNGLTAAGRALQKHGSRPGSAYPNVSGHNNLNIEGANIVEDLLTMPSSKVVTNSRGGTDVIVPDGRSMRFNSDGSFQGFREP